MRMDTLSHNFNVCVAEPGNEANANACVTGLKIWYQTV